MDKLAYDYSTKRFHRYCDKQERGTINEVYIPRHKMPQPVAEVDVSVSWTASLPVAEKAKPARA